MAEGYQTLMRTMDSAANNVERAKRDYMRKMNRLQRQDMREDRQIMNQLARQASQGMQILRKQFREVSREAQSAVVNQLGDARQRFMFNLKNDTEDVREDLRAFRDRARGRFD